MTLSAGTHSVELRGVGEPRTMTIAVTAGAQLSQYIELASGNSTMGRLQVRTEPAGALVTIDALPRGNTPITISNLDPGEHAVVLTSDAGSVTQSVTIEAGVTASLNVPIAPREVSPQSGWISVASPVDVQLFEGGRLLGSSQTDRIMVPSGAPTRLVNEARVSHDAQRAGDAGQGRAVPVKLPMGSVAINAIPWAEVWLDGTGSAKRQSATSRRRSAATRSCSATPSWVENPDRNRDARRAARLSVDMRKK